MEARQAACEPHRAPGPGPLATLAADFAVFFQPGRRAWEASQARRSLEAAGGGLACWAGMSFTQALARVSEIQAQAQQLAEGPQAAAAAAPAQSVTAVAPSQQEAAQGFGQALAGAQASQGQALLPVQGSGAAAQIVSLARAELAKGVTEANHSNTGADISRYASATRGATLPNPWCAYFVSYIARQAGVPIGYGGSGEGYVPDIRAWAQATGKWVPNQGAQSARPGDLIVFPGHVGIVDHVEGSTIVTIEGNHSDKVDQVRRGASEAVGYVRLAA